MLAMKQVFSIARTIHAWIGAVLALLLLLVSLTGTFLVWKQEYLWLTEPAARVDFTPGPESLSRIAEAVEARFGDDILSIQFATASLPLTYVVLADEEYAYFDSEGALVDHWRGNGRFEEWVYDLHHRLLLRDTGLTVVGFGATAVLAVVVLGLFTFWPFRRAFRRGLVPASLQRDELRSSHRNLGVILALPFVVTLVTGIVLAFPQQTEALLLEELRRTQEYSDAMMINLDEIHGGDSGDWLPAMQRALDVFPGAAIRSAQVPGAFAYYRIIGLQQPGELNMKGMSLVYIDAEEGYMDVRIDAQNLPAVERVYNSAYPLHTGRMDELWYRVLLTLVGAGVFLLSLAGLTSFIKQFR